MITLEAIETLLYDEADCLDAGDLDSWIELYTDDATYWMPVTPDQPDAINHISLIYDDHVMMEIRRRNFAHPQAASKDHAVRCSHIIGNVRTAGETPSGDLLVRSNFHALVFYRNEQRSYGGRYEHHVAPTPEGPRIRHKKVTLINCDAPQRTLTIYL